MSQLKLAKFVKANTASIFKKCVHDYFKQDDILAFLENYTIKY